MKKTKPAIFLIKRNLDILHPIWKKIAKENANGIVELVFVFSFSRLSTSNCRKYICIPILRRMFPYSWRYKSLTDPWKSKCMKTMISDHAPAVMIIGRPVNQ